MIENVYFNGNCSERAVRARVPQAVVEHRAKGVAAGVAQAHVAHAAEHLAKRRPLCERRSHIKVGKGRWQLAACEEEAEVSELLGEGSATERSHPQGFGT